MPRIARCVAPGSAHHITRRGTARQLVFPVRADRRVHLALLREQAGIEDAVVRADWLMPNHMHLNAVPHEEDSRAARVRRVHGRFAQYFNGQRLRCGHLWQNRFYACPMGLARLWTAIRHAESNPIRAGLVEQPVYYEGSSAEEHFSGHDRPRLLDMEFFQRSGGVENWRQLFVMPVSEPEYLRLRKLTHSGQPLGDELFRESSQFQQQHVNSSEWQMEVWRSRGRIGDSLAGGRPLAATSLPAPQAPASRNAASPLTRDSACSPALRPYC